MTTCDADLTFLILFSSKKSTIEKNIFVLFKKKLNVRRFIQLLWGYLFGLYEFKRKNLTDLFVVKRKNLRTIIITEEEVLNMFG